MRNIVFGALVVVALYCVVRVLLPGRQAAPPAGPQSVRGQREAGSDRPRPTARPAGPRVATPALRQRSSSDENPVPSVDQPPAPSAKFEVQAPASEQKAAPVAGQTQKVTPASQGTPGAPEALQDPVARVALGFVGADPDAESYWYEAINDPGLPAQERQDLIEDLNEDGLSDPQNPTADDLPLILNRVQLIEEVVWDAMDEVNADAFLEAYKDLVNLAFQALGNG